MLIHYYSQNAWLVKLDGKLVKKLPITAGCHLADRIMSRFAHLEKFSLHSSSLSFVIHVRLPQVRPSVFLYDLLFSLWYSNSRAIKIILRRDTQPRFQKQETWNEEQAKNVYCTVLTVLDFQVLSVTLVCSRLLWTATLRTFSVVLSRFPQSR